MSRCARCGDLMRVCQYWGCLALEPPSEPSLCWDVKIGWVPVRAIDPATGRCYVESPGSSAPTEG